MATVACCANDEWKTIKTKEMRLNLFTVFVCVLIHFNHCLNDTGSGIEPASKIIYHLIKGNPMGYVRGRIYLFGFQRPPNMLKIFARSIAATHQCGFAFVKFRVTE